MQVGSRARQATAGRQPAHSWRDPITLRLAAPSDRSALARLAQLDSRPLPSGPHLVAVREDRIDAAISLRTRELVADPFRHTAHLCELLRFHAPAFAGSTEIPARRLRPRPALATT
jgi:hypothetical protein